MKKLPDRPRPGPKPSELGGMFDSGTGIAAFSITATVILSIVIGGLYYSGIELYHFIR